MGGVITAELISLAEAYLRSPEFYVQAAASVTTLAGQWQYGSKRMLGPILGCVAQVFWWGIMFQGNLWGLLPLNIAMAFIHVRNLIKWRRDARSEARAG